MSADKRHQTAGGIPMHLSMHADENDPDPAIPAPPNPDTDGTPPETVPVPRAALDAIREARPTWELSYPSTITMMGLVDDLLAAAAGVSGDR